MKNMIVRGMCDILGCKEKAEAIIIVKESDHFRILFECRKHAEEWKTLNDTNYVIIFNQ